MENDWTSKQKTTRRIRWPKEPAQLIASTTLLDPTATSAFFLFTLRALSQK
jgi:hypothetical protein